MHRSQSGFAADVLIDAMITGIYCGDVRKLSIRSCLPRLVEIEEEYGSILYGFLRASTKPTQAEVWGLSDDLIKIIDAGSISFKVITISIHRK